MDKYQVSKTIGKGAFGAVYLGTNVKTGTKVAIKKLFEKCSSWKACLSLKEFVALKKLRRHENIVRVFEIVFENQQLHFILEFVQSNLLHTAASTALTSEDICCVAQQILRGLKHMHMQGFFHRDLKPENILCSKRHPPALTIQKRSIMQDQYPRVKMHPNCLLIKLTDFGITREIRSRPPFTPYISTRWYRAPELILRTTSYNSPVDIWAFACVVAELFIGQPLFPGTSSFDQAVRVFRLTGCPTTTDWSEGARLLREIGGTYLRLPKEIGAYHKKSKKHQSKCQTQQHLNEQQQELVNLLKARAKKKSPLFNAPLLSSTASETGSRMPMKALCLLTSIFVLHPLRRPTASQALKHAYFTSFQCHFCDPNVKTILKTTTVTNATRKNGAKDIGSNQDKVVNLSILCKELHSKGPYEHKHNNKKVQKSLDHGRIKNTDTMNDLLDEAEALFVEEKHINADDDFLADWDEESPEKMRVAEVKIPDMSISNIDANMPILPSDGCQLLEMHGSSVNESNSFDSLEDEVQSNPVSGAMEQNYQVSQLEQQYNEQNSNPTFVKNKVSEHPYDLTDTCHVNSDWDEEDGNEEKIKLSKKSTNEVRVCMSYPDNPADKMSPTVLKLSLLSCGVSSNHTLGNKELTANEQVAVDVNLHTASTSNDLDSGSYIIIKDRYIHKGEHNKELKNDTCNDINIEADDDEQMEENPTSTIVMPAKDAHVHDEDISSFTKNIVSRAENIDNTGSKEEGIITIPSLQDAVPTNDRAVNDNVSTGNFLRSSKHIQISAEPKAQLSKTSQKTIADAIVDAAIKEHLKKKGAKNVLEAYNNWVSKRNAKTNSTQIVSFHSRKELLKYAGPRITKYYRKTKKHIAPELSVLEAVVLANVTTSKANKKKHNRKKK